MARYQPSADGDQGRHAQQLQQDQGEGRGGSAGSRRLSTALRPSPEAMAQAIASNGPSQRAPARTSRLDGRGRHRQLLPGLHRIAE